MKNLISNHKFIITALASSAIILLANNYELLTNMSKMTAVTGDTGVNCKNFYSMMSGRK